MKLQRSVLSQSTSNLICVRCSCANQTLRLWLPRLIRLTRKQRSLRLLKEIFLTRSWSWQLVVRLIHLVRQVLRSTATRCGHLKKRFAYVRTSKKSFVKVPWSWILQSAKLSCALRLLVQDLRVLNWPVNWLSNVVSLLKLTTWTNQKLRLTWSKLRQQFWTCWRTVSLLTRVSNTWSSTALTCVSLLVLLRLRNTLPFWRTVRKFLLKHWFGRLVLRQRSKAQSGAWNKDLLVALWPMTTHALRVRKTFMLLVTLRPTKSLLVRFLTTHVQVGRHKRLKVENQLLTLLFLTSSSICWVRVHVRPLRVTTKDMLFQSVHTTRLESLSNLVA